MSELWIPVLHYVCHRIANRGAWVVAMEWIKAGEERMGLINQRIIPQDLPDRVKADPNRMVSLRNGIVLIALGIGLS